MKIDKKEFVKIVESILTELPDYFSKKIENVVIEIEDFSDEKSSDIYSILGLYRGVPYPKRGIYYGNVLPDVITIYQKPIETRVGSIEDLRRLTRTVIFHEIGHYFGLTDCDMYKIMNS